MSMNQGAALIALGANMPHSGASLPETIRAAIAAVQAAGLQVVAQSRLYSTPCFPPGAGPDYVNAATSLAGDLAPEEMLALCHRIEADLGRRRDSRWASRGVDIDLLAAGDRILPDRATQAHWRSLPLDAQMRDWPDGLILPHPRMAERAFVLIPLAEIAPSWRHPATGLDVATMAAALPEPEKAALQPFLRPFGGDERLSRRVDAPK